MKATALLFEILGKDLGKSHAYLFQACSLKRIAKYLCLRHITILHLLCWNFFCVGVILNMIHYVT